jgi:PKD repeat protein
MRLTGGYTYDQWHYFDTYGMRANTAWDTEAGSQNVLVGDLDIGTMYDHGDLGGSNPPGPNDASTNGNIWINTGETPGNGVDDDGNGYVDDILGWDFVDRTDWYSYACIDIDCGGADNDPSDGDGHGTHTAGTIAAITNNGYAVAGVAGGWGDGTFNGGGNGVKIVPCRIGYVLDYWIYGPTGVVIMDYVAEAMYYMADLKTAGWNVAAINCSFGSSNSGGLGAAADYLIAQDVVICVAAGNGSSSSPDYLGSRGDCLDVAATDQSGNNASFTNYGSWVDIAAPGVDVLSTITDPANPGVDYVAPLSGTSMSCPHVAGVVGLLESYNPTLSASDKIAIITDPANTNPYGGSRDLGAGIIDARKCLDAAGGGCDLAADFSGSPTSGCAPMAVNFTDLSTGTSIDGWSWTFGDGGTSTTQNPSYTYTTGGTFTVTLTVSSSSQSCNDVATKTNYITVNVGPTAGFVGSPTSGVEPLTVNFTDQSTGATSWSWSFGDGGTSTQQNPAYTYNAAGTYTVTLTATNACGSDDEITVDYITVDPCVAPTADFVGVPTSGSAPLTVDFTDQSTGNPTSWSWTFGDGGTSTQQNPSYTYNSAGIYTVTLTATNACGSDVATKVDYITVTEPQFSKAFALSDIPSVGTVTGNYTATHSSNDLYETITEELYTGHPVKRYSYAEHKWNFNISDGSGVTFYLEAYRNANTDGDDFVFEYSTDDVTYLSLVTVASATEQVYSVGLPNLNGTVWVRVFDTDRAWGNTSLDPLYVDEMYFEYSSTPAAPVANFSGSPASGDYPLIVNFTDLSTGSPDTWSWTFGDDGTSTVQNPSYTYNVAGTYTVSLTASNSYGSDTETKIDYITVTEPGTNTSHVSNMVVGRHKVGPNYKGDCTVTIFDQANAPLSGATVYLSYDGPSSGTVTGITASDGTVLVESGAIKKPVGEWCFEVTNVTHAIHSYDSGANAVTRACESGWVYGQSVGEVARLGTLPNEFALEHNRPNPFNPTTVIGFIIPEATHVTLEVYNSLGQKVETLVDRPMSAGRHETTWNAAGMPSGTYLYRLTAGTFTETKKMLLVK